MVVQGQDEVARDQRVTRLEFDRPAETRECIVEAPLILENSAQIAVGLGSIGLELDGMVVSGDRLVEPRPPPGIQGVTQIVVRLGVIGPELDGSVAGGDRLVEPFLVLEGNAQADVRLGIVGSQRYRPAASGDRFVEPSLLIQRIAQIDVRLGIIGSELDGPMARALIASSSCPLCLSALPRLLWASARSGRSAIALR